MSEFTSFATRFGIAVDAKNDPKERRCGFLAPITVKVVSEETTKSSGETEVFVPSVNLILTSSVSRQLVKNRVPVLVPPSEWAAVQLALGHSNCVNVSALQRELTCANALSVLKAATGLGLQSLAKWALLFILRRVDTATDGASLLISAMKNKLPSLLSVVLHKINERRADDREWILKEAVAMMDTCDLLRLFGPLCDGCYLCPFPECVMFEVLVFWFRHHLNRVATDGFGALRFWQRIQRMKQLHTSNSAREKRKAGRFVEVPRMHESEYVRSKLAAFQSFSDCGDGVYNESVRNTLMPFLSEIRFTEMSERFLSSVVFDSGLLTSFELLSIFAAKATKSAGVCAFKCERRVVAKCGFVDSGFEAVSPLMDWLVSLRPGVECSVFWGNSWWNARVSALKADSDLVRVTYPGWSHTWDEWLHRFDGVFKPMHYSGPTQIDRSLLF